MREFGLAQQISAAVQRRAAGRRVRSVRVRVGALRQVDLQALVSAFAQVTMGTPLDGTRLELIVVPARSRCRACDEVAVSTERIVACPSCPATEMEPISGNELALETIVPERQGRPVRHPTVGMYGMPPTGRNVPRLGFRQPTHGKVLPDWREGPSAPSSLW